MTRHAPLWLAAGAVVLYWLVESLLHTLVLHEASLGAALTTGETANELWMRATVMALILALGVTSDRLLSRQRRLVQDARGLNRLLRLLSEVNQHVQRQPTEGSLFEAACRAAVEIGGFCCAWVVTANGGRARLRALAATDREWAARARRECEVEAGQCPLVADIGEHGALVECHLVDRDRVRCPAAWRRGIEALGARRAVCLPLERDERRIGALVVHGDDEHLPSEEELAILGEVADDCSVALGNIAHRRAQEQAYAALDLRLAELERFRKATVDRELRIKELREEVTRLRARLAERGEGPPG